MALQTTAAGGGGVGKEAVEEAGTLRHRHNAAKNGGGGEEDGDVASLQSQLLAGGEGAGGNALSVERAFAEQAVPSWREQLTVRAFVVSFFLAIMFGIIVMKLNLTTGIILPFCSR